MRSVQTAAAEAVARHPELARFEGPFTEFLGSVPDLDALHVASLFLTWAAARGDGGSVQAVDALLAGEVKRVTRSMPAVSAHHDDICQRVRERLLMPDPQGQRGILQYSGCGPLESWLRTAALREALRISSLKAETPNARAPVAELADVPTLEADPELRFLKSHYREHFREAFTGAAAALQPGQRAILRLSYLEGLSIDRLALMYGIHRATAARRLAAARGELMAGLRHALGQRLGVPDSELDSVLKLVDTNLSLSFSVLLPEDR